MKYASSSQEGISKEIKKIKAKHPATFPDKLASDSHSMFYYRRNDSIRSVYGKWNGGCYGEGIKP